MHLSDAPSIRRIQGTEIGRYIRELNFKRADGHLVGKDNWYNRVLNFMRADGQLEGRILSQAGIPMADEEVLADDEQIIGVYGTYNIDICSLGMIVWRPYQA